METFNNGHINDRLLSILADALIQNPENVPDVPAVVLDHMEECQECKDKVMDVVLFLGNPKVTALPQKTRQQPLPLVETMHNRYFYPGKIAAVFVACAVMLSVYFFVFKAPAPQNRQHGNNIDGSITGNHVEPTISTVPEQNNGQPVATNTDITRNTNDLETKSRFTLNPNLENMIGSRVRSGVFEALSPTNNSVVKGIIHFSWKQEQMHPISLKIVSNRGDLLYTFAVSGQAFDFNEKLENGLYYWKLENDNELLYVGKFKVLGNSGMK